MTIRFGPFTLNSAARQLTREGPEQLHLSPKAFDLLVMLAEERPNVLSKETLQHRLWPDTFVAEANLSNLIAEIREALGDEARMPRFIRTVHRIGYAFCGEAAPGPQRDEVPARASCWVEWGVQRFPLVPGPHVIGRDPDADVRIDAATVSRCHARLSVTETGAVLEDLGSKNGTFLGSERIAAPTPLGDGDTFRVGSLALTFHVRAAAGLTDTQTEVFS